MMGICNMDAQFVRRSEDLFFETCELLNTSKGHSESFMIIMMTLLLITINQDHDLYYTYHHQYFHVLNVAENVTAPNANKNKNAKDIQTIQISPFV